MTVDGDDVACDQATLEGLHAEANRLRRAAGELLAARRQVAQLSQADLGRHVGIARTRISKYERGRPGGDLNDWRNMDEACSAGGDLLSAYQQAREACKRYAASRLAAQRAAQRAARLQRGLDALRGVARPGSGVASDARMTDGLVAELCEVLMRLAKRVGRRKAVETIFKTMVAVGLPIALDPDAVERTARSVCAPRRVNPAVIDHLSVSLRSAQRLEDIAGPSAVLSTVQAQRDIVRGLLDDCPEGLRPRLLALDSRFAASIGSYWLDLGDPKAATDHFDQARLAGYEAGNDACASFGLLNLSYVASLDGDAITALETAAAARLLAARSGDPLLLAESEKIAAVAYALERNERACLTTFARAENTLSMADRPPDSLAYSLDPAHLASSKIRCCLLLNRPKEAVAAASLALKHDEQQPVNCARAKIRYADALVVSQEIGEATHQLAGAADLAVTCPSDRLTADLLTVRAKMQQSHRSKEVQTLDERLRALGLVRGARKARIC